MVQAGWIRHIGLSDVGADTIRPAADVTPIGDVQIEYSVLSRGVEDAVLPACRELGIGLSAYSVLGRGRSHSGLDFRRRCGGALTPSNHRDQFRRERGRPRLKP